MKSIPNQQTHTPPDGFAQAASLCGFGALVYWAVSMLVSELLNWVLAQNSMQAWQSNAVAMLALQVGGNLLSLLAPFFLLFAQPLTAKQLYMQKARKGTLQAAFLVFWVLVMAGNAAAMLLGKWLHQSHEQVVLPQEMGLLLTMWVGLAVVPALAEELLFRGLLQGYLRRYGAWISIVGQAVVFALLHGEAPSCLAALFGGIALGICAEMTQSLWCSMLFHLYNNTMAFAAQYYSQYGGESSLQRVLQFSIPAVVLLGYLVERVKHTKQKPLRFAKDTPIFMLAKSLGWCVCVVILVCKMVLETVA